MGHEMIFVIGGVAVVAVIVAMILANKKGDKASIVDSMDEQLVVIDLRADDIKSWFKQKNPDDKYTNIVMRMTAENLKSVNVSEENRAALESASKDAEKCIIQAVVDNEADEIVSCRAVVYENISEKLDTLLTENNGVLILE